MYEKRAATILFHFLNAAQDKRPYLIPANVCTIVPLVFLKARQPFEFVDIAEQTLCMDEQRILQLLSDNPGRYGGVLFVRNYGVADSFEKFFQAIKDRDATVRVIDDRCLCIPDFETAPSASVDLTLFSTGYAKYSDIGRGGFGFLGSDNAYERKSCAFSQRSYEKVTQACKVACAQRKKMIYQHDDWLDTEKPPVPFEEYRQKVKEHSTRVSSHKKSLNALYGREIPAQVQFPAKYQEWRFNIRVPDRDKLMQELFAGGLFASAHYQPLGDIFLAGRSSRAEQLHANVVNLFNDFRFDIDRAGRVAQIVNCHLSKHGTVANRPLP